MRQRRNKLGEKEHALQIAILADVPVLWQGSPGVGKTFSLIDFFRTLDWPHDVWILSVSDPTDIGGIPFVNDDGSFSRLAPKRLIQLCEAVEKKGAGALFLDELSTAPPALQAAGLRVTQSDPDGYRWVGDQRLPRGLRVVAAANPVAEAAGGWELAAPLANRFYHHKWTKDTSAWIDGMRYGWDSDNHIKSLREDWESRIPHWRSYVASFIKARPALLLSVPSDDASKGGAWPSPRTWDMSARLLAASEGTANDLTQMELVSGCVGEGAASEFVQWIVSLDLPTPEQVLEDPKRYYREPKPDEEHRVFAILSSACTFVNENPQVARWDQLWQLLIHAGKWSPDVVFAHVNEIGNRIMPKIKDGTPRVPEAGKNILREMGAKTGIGE
jgi:hypothetical protein